VSANQPNISAASEDITDGPEADIEYNVLLSIGGKEGYDSSERGYRALSKYTSRSHHGGTQIDTTPYTGCRPLKNKIRITQISILRAQIVSRQPRIFRSQKTLCALVKRSGTFRVPA